MKLSKDTWIAIVNPKAGSGKTYKEWDKAEELLKQNSIPFLTRLTNFKMHATDLAVSAAKQGYRNFIAVGGDGTVHETLDGILKFIVNFPDQANRPKISDFTLAVIPIGSGNDWIKSLSVPKDSQKLIELIKNKSYSRQDVVKARILDPKALPEEKVLNIDYMANIGGVGLDALVCRRVNRMKERGKRGKLLYVTSLIHNIIHKKASYAKVYCDDELIFSGKYLSMALGVGKYSGGGMRQTADAIMDDGLLDITIIPDINYGIIAKEAYKLFTGTFTQVRYVTTGRGKTIKVLPYNDSNDPVEVDGELIGNIPVVFDVLPDQLNVLSLTRKKKSKKKSRKKSKKRI